MVVVQRREKSGECGHGDGDGAVSMFLFSGLINGWRSKCTGNLRF